MSSSENRLRITENHVKIKKNKETQMKIEENHYFSPHPIQPLESKQHEIFTDRFVYIDSFNKNGQN